MQRKYYNLICLIALTLLFNCKQKENTQEPTNTDTTSTNDSTLKEALTFYASFDSAIDADFALGDSRLYTVPDRKARDSAQVGLHKPEVTREAGTGKFGAGLVFAKNGPGYIYYPSEGNIVYNNEDWSATISFWLLLDPATDLDPGFCDPIQITDSGYNDAGIWVDFTKENPRDFRLGVIGDREVWNPNPEGPDNANPIFIERLTGISNPPFSRERWTHVVITFKGLNTANGEAS